MEKLKEAVINLFGDIVKDVHVKEGEKPYIYSNGDIDIHATCIIIDFTNGKSVKFMTSEWGLLSNPEEE